MILILWPTFATKYVRLYTIIVLEFCDARKTVPYNIQRGI